MSSLALIPISYIYALLLIPSQHWLTIFLKYDAVKCNVLNDYTYPTLNQATHRNVGYEEMMGVIWFRKPIFKYPVRELWVNRGGPPI